MKVVLARVIQLYSSVMKVMIRLFYNKLKVRFAEAISVGLIS
jgi:hypothetical protein